ncbi:phosphatase 2C-like domain-containing protein, partial [Pavlovales sp. CCMP2436]
GTTAVVLVLSGAVCHVASVGDSRLVLGRGARAVRVTADHKPRLQAEEARIVELGGFVSRGRVHGILSVSRSLGDFEFAPFVLAEPQVLSFRLTADDRCLLLASDGLWDVISDDEAVEIALRMGTGPAADPTAAGQFLVDEALRRGSRDNVSVVCV